MFMHLYPERANHKHLMVLLIAIGMAVMTAVPGLAAPSEGSPAIHGAARAVLHLERVEIQAFSLPAPGTANLRLAVLLGGVPCTLDLQADTLRSPGFRLLAQGADGTLRALEPPAPRTYRGRVLGRPESRVAASLDERGLSAMILLDGASGGTGEWYIQPLQGLVTGATAGSHAVYAAEDVRGDGGWRCGFEDLPPLRHGDGCPCHPEGTGSGTSTTGATGVMICDLGLDADYEFYKKNGYSVSATLADMENVLNNVRTVYERDVSITYELTTAIIRTAEPDPYTTTDPSGLLNEFKNEWNANNKGIKRDTAHLFTGKNLNGSVIGVAWASVICFKNSAYGLSQSKFSSNMKQRSALTAHELGHNWSAQHCDGNGDCHIMCSVLGGCNGIGLPNFGAASINKIVTYRDTRTCLWEQMDPVIPPFSEGFPTTDLNHANWSYKNGTAIVDTAVGEPSAPYALEIDASGAGAYEEDEIRSNEILLAGQSNLVVSYFTEHRGVEAGESLVVEYRAADGTWKEIETIVSDGGNQNTFTFHTHALPGDAYHDGFRLRFRSVVDETNDDWFLDDVFVGEPQPDPPVVTGVSPSAGIEAGGTPVTVTGANFTASPPTSVTIGNAACSNVLVVDSSTITCVTGPETQGFKDVTVQNSYGIDVLADGFRYFPVNVDPFNAASAHVENLTAPAAFELIVSGYPGNTFVMFLSFSGGPVNTPYGVMGLGFPLVYLFTGFLGGQGYLLLPSEVQPGTGPVEFYVHVLGLDAGGDPVWSWGGNNPNGTGSIFFHVNN